MDDFLKRTLLYDFYGELLTAHQKEIYEQAVLEDLSLGEIASDYGISRQGVHDLIKRCDRTLKGYEEKLHLVERFLDIRDKIKRIDEILEKSPEDLDTMSLRQEIKTIADEIIKEL